MKYIIQALRTTYHTERKANIRLNDLINQLEETPSDAHKSIHELLTDINTLLQESA